MKELPDIIKEDLRVLFIGYNPSLRSAELGHHYAGKNNKFWKLLNESGLLPVPLTYEQDGDLLLFGYGSTNIVSRPTRAADEITPVEYDEGKKELIKLLQRYRPFVACYCGIGVYKAFTGKDRIHTGLQTDKGVSGNLDYVCSSPSGLNRIPYEKQLDCFKGLKEIADLIT